MFFEGSYREYQDREYGEDLRKNKHQAHKELTAGSIRQNKETEQQSIRDQQTHSSKIPNHNSTKKEKLHRRGVSRSHSITPNAKCRHDTLSKGVVPIKPILFNTIPHLPLRQPQLSRGTHLNPTIANQRSLNFFLLYLGQRFSGT